MRAATRSFAIAVAGCLPWCSMLGCEGDTSSNLPCDGGDAGDAALDGPRLDATVDAGDATKADADAASEAAGDATAETGIGNVAEAGITDAARDAKGGTTATASLRVANWSPDAPQVDFCVAPQGSTAFLGPVLAMTAGGDGAIVGLTFPSMSSYVAVPSGMLDVRIVVAGGGVCAGVVPDVTNLAAPSGGYLTVALLGMFNPLAGAPGLQAAALSAADEHSTSLPDGGPSLPDGGPRVALRFVNAAPEFASVDFGTGAAGTYQALLSAVRFGPTSPAPTGAADGGGRAAVDSYGYLNMAPGQPPQYTSTSFTVRARGAATDLVSGSDVAAAGSVFTVALVGSQAAGGSLGLWRCVDNAGTTGYLGNCAYLMP